MIRKDFKSILVIINVWKQLTEQKIRLKKRDIRVLMMIMIFWVREQKE